MRKPAVVALLPLLFAGCTFGPKYKRPQIQPPASYYAEPQTRENSVADLAWWDLFKDPVLQGLIREAFKRSEEHTSELQSRLHLVCRLLLEKKKHITQVLPTVYASKMLFLLECKQFKLRKK